MSCPVMRVLVGVGIWPFGDAMGAISGESPVVLFRPDPEPRGRQTRLRRLIGTQRSSPAAPRTVPWEIALSAFPIRPAFPRCHKHRAGFCDLRSNALRRDDRGTRGQCQCRARQWIVEQNQVRATCLPHSTLNTHIFSAALSDDRFHGSRGRRCCSEISKNAHR